MYVCRWDMRYSVTRGFTIVGREDRIQGNANLTLSSALVGESAVLKALTKVMYICMYVCKCMYVNTLGSDNALMYA